MPLSALHVVVNPKSGGGRAGRGEQIDARLRALGLRPTIHHTEAQGHATDLARNLAQEGADAVIAAGGDGTIHEVANGLLTSGTATALGVIPSGTGNDFAKLVPGAESLGGACAVIARGNLSRFDVGHAAWDGGDEFFVNAMGIGIDVEVVRQIHKLPHLPGPLKYLLGLFRALAVYDPISLTAQLGGERLDRTVMMMAVGNGVCQGGGFYLTPDASPQDERLDLCVVDSIPLWLVPSVLTRVLRGSHTRHASVTMRRFERVRFEANGAAPLYFQLDGELREPPTARWLEINVRKAALNVVAGMETIK